MAEYQLQRREVCVKNAFSLRVFTTSEQPCAYLNGRRARNLVADPSQLENRTYSQLARLGFRRSGNHLYRPHCTGCQACLSLRIPVREFRPDRSMRRNLRANRSLSFEPISAEFREEHFQLYCAYLRERHPGGGMDEPLPLDYSDFLLSDWAEVRCYEIRDARQLLGVAVTDLLEDGFSAVYTFFVRSDDHRGLGTWAILKQIEETRRANLPWLYLGYWIEACRKMAYKAHFQPHEIYRDGLWQRHSGKP